MKRFWHWLSRTTQVIPSRRGHRLCVETLEDRAVPSAAPAFDPTTIVVGFRTSDPSEPVEAQSVTVEPGQTVDDALAYWRQAPNVAYAEPNYMLGTDVMPNDQYTSLLYAQNNTGQSGGTPDADMDAAEAWNITTGSLQTVVAVIDTGIDYAHPDLYKNIWINQVEIPTAIRTQLTDTDGDGRITFWDLNNSVNIGVGKITDLNGDGYIDGADILRPIAAGGWADGIDEGGNGYTDDLIGWDFVGNDNDPMDVVAEDGGHGTHVAGTIGAIGNNGVGVNGVAWQVELMAVRFLGTGGGSSANAAKAIRYAAANGAVISNNSWGGGGYSQTLYDAINYARSQGQVFVAAAGNAASDNDTTASYPADYALNNIVTVAASDRNDNLASFSNYGKSSVELAAAGVDIASTYPGAHYAYMSGTSMATPQVSGAFALLLSQDPSLSYSQAISRLLSNVDPVSSLSASTITGGRLNVDKALASGSSSGDSGGSTGSSGSGSSSSPQTFTTSTTLQSSSAQPAFDTAVTLAAQVVSAGGTPTGAVTFVNATTGATLGTARLDASGFASLTTSGFALGDNTITAVYTGDGTYQGSSGSTTEHVSRHAIYATSVNGTVFVYDGPTGVLLGSGAPFGVYPGGVKVAVGDVNGDGYDDLILVGGLGTENGRVFIVSGRGFGVLADYRIGYPGELNVAAGDVNGDGKADVIISTATDFDFVRVYSGSTQSVLSSYSVFGGLRLGVTIAAGDFDGDGKAEVIAGTAKYFGGAVVVRGLTGARLAVFELPVPADGVSVAAGDVNGDGKADVIFGMLTNYPIVAVYDAASRGLLGGFFAYPNESFGVRVSTVDRNGNGAEILTGPATGHASPRFFDGLSFAVLNDVQLPVSDQSLVIGGVYVGGAA